MTSRRRNSFHIDRQQAGQITNIGRDQINVNGDSFLYALQRTHGFGRVLAFVGGAVALVGMGMFGFAVVSFIVAVITEMSREFQPGQMPTLDIAAIMLPWLPVGIGLAFLGSVVANLGIMVGGGRH